MAIISKNTVSRTINGIEYTIVLDKDQLLTKTLGQEKTEEKLRKDIDSLYEEYEKMRLAEPMALDRDDIYPHSYQWRIGDKYDLGKVAAIEEALKTWKPIEETEAYSKYIETISNRSFKPDWE